MKRAKARIIKSEGNEVRVTRYLTMSPIEFETIALLGRMEKSPTNMKRLESFKQGVFLPGDGIESGDFIYNIPQNEHFVVSANHIETHRNQHLSTVADLLKCNHLIGVISMQEVADNRGNVKYLPVTTYEAIPCYIEKVTSDLRQIQAGIHPDTEFLVYTSSIDVDEEDQIQFFDHSTKKPYKVIATDYVTYPMMVVIEIRSDVRK